MIDGCIRVQVAPKVCLRIRVHNVATRELASMTERQLIADRGTKELLLTGF